MKKSTQNKSDVVKNIYKYSDYRSVLSEYFNEQKRIKPQFSHRFFTQKAGISSSGYCAKVISGSLKVSKVYAEKLSKGMGLNEDEKVYFCLLVDYAHRVDVDEKLKLKREIDLLREKSESKSLTAAEIDFYKFWYVPVVRELVHYADWDNDFKKLGKMVYPPISMIEAEKAVKTLVEIGMIEKNESGYRKVNNVVNSGMIPTYARKKARREVLERGKESVELLSHNERHVSYTTLSMSEKTYGKVEEYINKMRQEILDMAIEDQEVEKIYHAVFELFPSSTKIGG